MKQRILKLSLALITLAGAAQIHAAAGGPLPEKNYNTLEHLSAKVFKDKIKNNPEEALVELFWLIDHNASTLSSMAQSPRRVWWDTLRLHKRLAEIKSHIPSVRKEIDDNPTGELAGSYYKLLNFLNNAKNEYKKSGTANDFRMKFSKFIDKITKSTNDDTIEEFLLHKFIRMKLLINSLFAHFQDNPLDPKDPRQMLVDVMNTFNRKMMPKDGGILDQFPDEGRFISLYGSLLDLYVRLINQYYQDSKQAASDHGGVLRLFRQIKNMMIQKQFTKDEKQKLWEDLYKIFLRVMETTTLPKRPTQRIPARIDQDILNIVLNASIHDANKAISSGNDRARKKNAENIKDTIKCLAGTLTAEEKNLYQAMVVLLRKDPFNDRTKKAWSTLYETYKTTFATTPSTTPTTISRAATSGTPSTSAATTAGAILSESVARNLKNKAQQSRNQVRASLTGEQVRNLRFTAERGSGNAQKYAKEALVSVDKAPAWRRR